MDTTNSQSGLDDPHQIDIWQKFKNKKFIFIASGVILIAFLTILSFSPEKHLEEKNSTSISTSTPLPVTPTIRAPRVEDQVILKFKKGVTDEQINEHLKQYNATIIEKIYGTDLILVNVPTGQGDVMLDAFQKDNIVEQAQPNYIYEATTNDQSYNLQWGLKNTGQDIEGKKGMANADINAEAAWAVTKGNGVKIAVLDTGIDPNHPDISSKIVAQKDFTSPPQGVNDLDGHGTHVAGIVAAVTDNTTGIAGICPECQLVIAKTIGNDGLANTSNIVSAVNWVADPNQGDAKVINMSLAGPVTDPALQQAINDAWGKGVVIVAAAGNKGNTAKMYPGAYTNVVSVAATDNNDMKASFSNYGTWVSVAAPGVAIYSTLPTYPYNMQVDDKTQLNYDYLSGTSMATPMTSGVVGLILASHAGISNADAVKILCDTSDKITGTGTNWICGRINAGKAVVGSIPISNPVSTAPSLSTIVPTFNCLGNSCPTPSPTPILTSMPNQSPVLSDPVTQPTYIQPSNPLPSVTESNPPPNNPNSVLSKLICYIILFILKLLGIDLSNLGVDFGSKCNNI